MKLDMTTRVYDEKTKEFWYDCPKCRANIIKLTDDTCPICGISIRFCDPMDSRRDTDDQRRKGPARCDK